MRPLCADWREAGLDGALRRLLARRRGATPVAPWLLGGTFAQAASAAGGRRAAALRRLALGAELEKLAATRCKQLSCGSRRAIEHASGAAQREATQLYHDAFLVAVWTSAHAEYVAVLDDEEGDAEPPPPTLHTVPNALSGIDLSDLYARRANPRESGVPKVAEPLVALLSRCTNPGARGWDSVLEDALKDLGARTIVRHALLVCITGLHSQLHPCRRAPWPTRLVALRVARLQLTDRKDAARIATQTKEAMRRCLASTLAVDPAMHAALAALGHPVRHLYHPPHALPHRGMEGSMTAFAESGVALGGSESACGAGLARALTAAFARRHADDGGDSVPNDGLVWDPSWLGKVRTVHSNPNHRVRKRPDVLTSAPSCEQGTPDVHSRQSLVSLASDVWSAAFRAHFVAFWLFAQSRQMRVTRLDAAQYEAVHGLNAATRLVAQLDVGTALRVQRQALRNPSAGLLTIGEAARELGLCDVVASAPSGGARGAQDGARMLGDVGALGAAQLLCYARAAWVSEEVVVVDLGAHTAALQRLALHRRLGTSIARDEALPMHATHVCACTECHRVANAHVAGTGGAPFNEFGVSSCQIATECMASGDPVRLHCAKRSSAALRTALAFEGEMKRRCIECEDVDGAAIGRLTTPRKASSVDSGVAARVRRDGKNALEQRPSAVACGEHPMLTVPIIGRAVRIYKAWYALCAYCAALVKVQPHLHRYGTEICCLRCDDGLMRRALPVEPPSASVPTRPSAKQSCRYCGCVCEGSGAGWRRIKAPLDVAGPNAMLPPPLRHVWYCRQHYRGWVAQAHRVLETRVVLAHLAHNAKPLYGADTATQAPAAARPQARSRRRVGGKRRR